MAPPRWAVVGTLLVASVVVWPVFSAVEGADPPPVSSEQSERAQLFIALLKRRAEAIVEARRAPPPPFWSVYGGVSEGYESNVNLDGSRKGDPFTEESFSVVARPKVTSWLSGEITYDLLHTHYQAMTDSNLWSNTVEWLLKYQPLRRVEVATGYEYGVLNFPHDTSSSFADQRTKASLTWAQAGWLTHVIGWVYQLREYDTRKARDAAGTALEGVNRQDQRHTGSYELRFRFPKLLARLGAEWYRNSANDQLQDFYDWDDVRVRAVLTRVFNPKWVGTVSASHERKNYQSRSVPAINVAERDDLVTVAGSLIYQATPHASVAGSLTYRHQDSNDPRLDFTDWISQLSVSIGF
ncbi:MAG: hypothetical protein HY600_07335 [Candidatus Omnitrophica bacterium]|nr:hypothetical protein [Candidatus Omnitrophota bacterium]